ncbi:MAG TPA: FtsQ-type POTRA domain-containing protein [Gemmatimonadales bacterium]|jgi:hypothetical protein
MTRRSSIALIGAMLLCGALVVVVPRGLRQLTYFRVRRVEVVGTHYLDEYDVVSRLHLSRTASVFDGLAPIQRAAAAVPGVLSATVTRRLPGTIRVTLREARAVALTPTGDRLGLIDSVGRLLPFDPTRSPVPLPVAPPDSASAALLARMAASDPDLYGTIESVRLDRGAIVLDVGGHSIRVLPDADDDVFRAIAAVRSYLVTNPQPWRELDARYHTRVFLRKGSA